MTYDPITNTITREPNNPNQPFVDMATHGVQMLGELSSMRKASDGLKQDAKVIYGWLGQDIGPLTPTSCEKLKTGILGYASNWAAPSPELQRVFDQLQLKEGSYPRPPDEVRDAFDRWFTADEKIVDKRNLAEPVQNIERVHNGDLPRKKSTNVQMKPNPSVGVADMITSVVERLRAKGHEIPSRISEIPGFPCQTFDALRAKLSTGELILYRPTHNYSSEVFELMATRGEKAAYNMSILVLYVLPILAIALGLFVRWPWALLCPFLIYTGWKIGSSTLRKALFRSAAESEMNFCFLLYSYKVGVALPDFSKRYVWEGSYPTARV